MVMPGREYSGSNDYRYGFNGKENDNEVKGDGMQLDYGFRIYDPRLGRFLTVDPISSSFPWNSSYAFGENDVIRSIDLDGLEKIETNYYKKGKDGNLLLSKQASVEILNNVSTPEIHKLELTIGSTKLSNGKTFNIIQSYSLNSEVTLKGRNEAGDLKTAPSIRTLSDDDMGRVLAYSSVVFEKATEIRDWKDVVAWVMTTYKTTAARYESASGLLDFKNVVYDLLEIDKNSLLEINGVIYNANEAGNYLWGMALTFAGTYGDPSEAAEDVTWNSQGRHDEEYDQKAINAGEKFGRDLKSITPIDNSGDVKKAYKKNKENGQANKDYSSMKKAKK